MEPAGARGPRRCSRSWRSPPGRSRYCRRSAEGRCTRSARSSRPSRCRSPASSIRDRGDIEVDIDHLLIRGGIDDGEEVDVGRGHVEEAAVGAQRHAARMAAAVDPVGRIELHGAGDRHVLHQRGRAITADVQHRHGGARRVVGVRRRQRRRQDVAGWLDVIAVADPPGRNIGVPAVTREQNGIGEVADVLVRLLGGVGE